MVNTGKPSGGCETCKKRKIKCDQTRPYCIRCQKVGKECPGVPEPAELALRVLRWGTRRKPSPPRPAKALEPLDDWNGSSSDSCSERDVSPAMDGELRYPIELQALALFFHDYAGRPGDPRLRQRPFFLLPQIHASSSPSEPVHHALSACAIYCLARYTNAPHLRPIGNEKYFEGLTALQRSLRAGPKALTDGVLGGILMLKVFEMHAVSGGSLDAYFHHAEGAHAVIKRRGKAQFYNPNSLKIFRAFRTQLISTAIEGGSAYHLLDEDFDWFGDRNMPDDTIENTQLMHIGYDICMIRNHIAEWIEPLSSMLPDFAITSLDYEDPLLGTMTLDETLERDQKLQEFSEDLTRLDQNLDSWFENIPSEWWPEIIHINKPRPDVWNKTAFNYIRPLAAALLSFAQMLRLIINGLFIKTQLRRGLEVPVSKMFEIRMAVDFISGNLPLAWGSDAIDIVFKKRFLDPSGWIRANAIFHIHAIYFAAAVGDIVPADQRLWLKARLQDLSDTYGYQSAGLLASKLPI